VAAEASPAATAMRPPAPEVLSPTTILTLPAGPPVVNAEPVRSNTDPLLPEEAVPDLNDRAPLVPEAPAWAVLRLNAPLEVALLAPFKSEIDPPVAMVEYPATNTMRPAPPVLPAPTLILTLPEAPVVADFARSISAPLLPAAFTSPVWRCRAPLALLP